MPLSPPATRQQQHNRSIECRGYERADGLWDIEGHLVDTKTYVTNKRDTGRERQPGEPIHDMWLRLTIDLDMKIHEAEAATDASPYAPCGNITPNFKALKGITIGAGWRRKTLEKETVTVTGHGTTVAERASRSARSAFGSSSGSSTTALARSPVTAVRTGPASPAARTVGPA